MSFDAACAAFGMDEIQFSDALQTLARTGKDQRIARRRIGGTLSVKYRVDLVKEAVAWVAARTLKAT
jgi:hypothetical protein